MNEERAMTEEDAKRIAKEAYIFAYPMLEHYKTMYDQVVDTQSPNFIGPLNRFNHARKLLTPDFTAVVTPNNDTLYSIAWLDLQAEPLVLRVPEVPDGRYYSFQFVDAFTFNWAYVGSRATGSEGGTYLIAGPGWEGEAPDGVDGVLRAHSRFVLVLGRTAVSGEPDLPNVHALQDQYRLVTLSEFTGAAAPLPAPIPDFPVWDSEDAASAGFVDYMNFLLPTVELYPEMRPLIEKSAAIGIGANLDFGRTELEPDMQKAVEAGVAAAQEKIGAKVETFSVPVNGWSLSTEGFGDHEAMIGKDLLRAVAAMFGIYGNTLEEAYYQIVFTDDHEAELDGSKHDYIIDFTRETLPPVNAFWSISMYRLPDRLFVVNELERYSIGDRTPDLSYEENGSLKLYICSQSPGAEKETNWLPAPDGPFYLASRLYLPRPEAIGASPYAPPEIRAVDIGALKRAA